jgi:hypothetical protein
VPEILHTTTVVVGFACSVLYYWLYELDLDGEMCEAYVVYLPERVSMKSTKGNNPNAFMEATVRFICTILPLNVSLISKMCYAVTSFNFRDMQATQCYHEK